MKEININIPSFAIILFIGTFITTYILVPKIIEIAKKTNLFDKPNKRSSHKIDTPTLGGIAFYITLVIGFFFISYWDNESITLNILVGIILLFFIGLKDDLVGTAPSTKVLIQILAIGIILYDNNFIIDNLNGFIGIKNLSKFISYPLSCFIMLVIINSYNLIDGIDGLATSIAGVICFVFGILFNYLEMYFYGFLCVLVLGMSFAFLRYNLSHNQKKIFMGDTGSLIIGYIISILTIRFLCVEGENLEKLPFRIESTPLLVISILIIPLLDTGRVFIIRIINKKSPFKADKKHIHHIILSLGLNHLQASILICIINIFIIFFFIIISYIFSPNILTIIFFLFIVIIVSIISGLDFSFSAIRNKIIFMRVLGWKKKRRKKEKNSYK